MDDHFILLNTGRLDSFLCWTLAPITAGAGKISVPQKIDEANSLRKSVSDSMS